MESLVTHGVIGLVRNPEGKFLLLEDSREPMQGHWAPPHGRCNEQDKDEVHGVIREVHEETGLQVKPLLKVLEQAADTKVKSVAFWTVSCEDTGTITLNEESSRHDWFTPQEALQIQLYPGTRLFFEKLIAGEVIL